MALIDYEGFPYNCSGFTKSLNPTYYDIHLGGIFNFISTNTFATFYLIISFPELKLVGLLYSLSDNDILLRLYFPDSFLFGRRTFILQSLSEMYSLDFGSNTLNNMSNPHNFYFTHGKLINNIHFPIYVAGPQGYLP